jgi:hypothetical protein
LRAFKPHNGSGSTLSAAGPGLTEKKMRLTLHTDYALRVLLHVAIADGKLITISDIAESFDISKQHLMKVANDLSQKGYLDTMRGRGGGIPCVARRATSISAKWCARPRTSSMLSAVWGGAVIAGSRRVVRCASGVSRCLGWIYTGRSDQAAEGVVVIVAARSDAARAT